MSRCGGRCLIAYASELLLLDEEEQLARWKDCLGGEVPRKREECKRKVEDVLSKRDDLPVRPDATASQISSAYRTSTATNEKLRWHVGRSATSSLQLELSHLWSDSHFLNAVARVVINESAAYPATLVIFVSSQLNSLKFDSRSITDLQHVV